VEETYTSQRQAQDKDSALQGFRCLWWNWNDLWQSTNTPIQTHI